MRRWLGFIALSVIGLFSGLAVADYTVKDASNSTQTVFAFVCFVSKICPAHVLVTSAGVEIVPSTAALQTTGNTALSTINTTLGSPLQAGGTVVVTGVATAANQTTANSSLATIATNTGAAIPTQAPTVDIGAVGISQTTPGTTNAVAVKYGTTALVADPCQAATPAKVTGVITSGTTTNILTGTAAQKIYVCYFYMQTNLANNVAVIEGTTGGTCGSGTAALVGGTTAANGLNNAANSGQSMGNGAAYVLNTETNNNDICLITSSAGPLAYVMKYVKR